MNPAHPDTIAIFGGSGSTGLLLIDQALRADYKIQALIRPGSTLGDLEASLEVTRGAHEVASDVDHVLRGSTAVCCLFGPRPPYSDIFCAAATEAILDGMQRERVRRIVCLTGAMIGDYPANRTAPFRLLCRGVRKRNLQMMLDRDRQEFLITESGLAWTLVKPPRLTNQARSRHLRASPDLRVGLLSKLSRADVAWFILNEIQAPRHIGRAVFLRA